MAIKISFQRELVELNFSDIIITRDFSPTVKQNKKYKQIATSIKAMGVIEPPAVAKCKEEGKYILLDGHLRLMALRELGHDKVKCLVSCDDEAYTYNKYVNRISIIQEHKMILKAMKKGTTAEQIAESLGIHITTLQGKLNMLHGLCPQVLEMLKDKTVPEKSLRYLRKMKAVRQVKAVTLMNDQNNYSSSFAKALFEGTPQDQLVDEKVTSKFNPALAARQARLEEENLALAKDLEQIKSEYSVNMLNLTSIQSYLKRILSNEEVVAYLQQCHETVHEKFVEIMSFDLFVPNAEGTQ